MARAKLTVIAGVGFIPTTSRLEVLRIIQLSYGAFRIYPEKSFCPERLRQLPRLIKRDDARSTQAEIMLQRNIGIVDLPRICCASKLMRQLITLREACRTQRMALRQ